MKVSSRRARLPAVLAALLASAALVSGCMNGGVLRAAVPPTVPAPSATPLPSHLPDPQTLAFPRDDGPHQRLTEWWYYTGHLSASGRRYGFEFVIFRAERGDYPVAWASHFAITDPSAGAFVYDQRSEFGPQVDRSPTDGGFDFVIQAPLPGTAATTPWTMQGGGGGDDHLNAGTSSYAIDLDLTSRRPPVLHDGTGWIDLGPAGGTYYYSRTRLNVRGAITRMGGPASGVPLPVTGLAWFDHQWGDFIAVGAGGWDWFSVQLDDGRDLMISLVRGPGGIQLFHYGTLVARDGSSRQLSGDQIKVEVLKHWKSPHSGADYPTEWNVALPSEGLTLHLTPALADQELDTRQTSGVFYWEGAVTVLASQSVPGGGFAGPPIGGVGYVELTGYAP